MSNGAAQALPPTGHGLVVGSFMPPHAGHRLLIEFARARREGLVIVLVSSDGDPLPGALRHQWLREMSGPAEIVHLELGSESPGDAAAERARQLDGRLPAGINCLFGNDKDDAELAKALSLDFVAIDPKRAMVPVSASDVRADPMSHWEYIPECARGFFAQRVCIYGPAGTGKSALVEQLCIHYDTAWAAEYRPAKKAPVELEQMDDIGRSQAAIEDAMARQANRVLFCDGGVLGAAVRSQRAFKQCPPALRKLSDTRQYAQILLMDLDPVMLETAPKRRATSAQAEFEAYRQTLILADRRYLRLDGDYDTRFRIACDAVDILIGQPTGRPPRPDL